MDEVVAELVGAPQGVDRYAVAAGDGFERIAFLHDVLGKLVG